MKTLKYLLPIMLLPFLGFTQHTLQGEFSPAESYSFAFLYKSTPKGAAYINQSKLDSLGKFTIALDSTLTPGIYKVVYAMPPEKNNFDIIYDGEESVAFTFNKSEGLTFTSSVENKLWNSYMKSINMVNATISNYYAKDGKNKSDFKSVFKTLQNTQKSYEDAASGKMVSAFIKANTPYIPKTYEDVSAYSQNLKATYLQHLDFTNDLLLSSSFVSERITNYIFNMVSTASNDTFKQLVDEAAKSMNTAEQSLQTNLMASVWQNFVGLNNHEMANYVTTNYLLKLAEATKNEQLATTIVSYKNTSIGKKAPNFNIKTEPEFGELNTNLHDIDGAENYLVIFWSSGCGHCLNELPMVKTLVAKKPTLKVIAFGLENDTKNWSEVIKDYPEFIHTYGLGKWKHPIVKTYGVQGTPSYLMLSADKIIMSKPYSFEDLKTVVESL